MPVSPLSANRLSAFLVMGIVLIALVLLIGRMFDMRFAGGLGLGEHATASLIALEDVASDNMIADATSLRQPNTIVRGQTVTTGPEQFSYYRIHDADIALAENTSITLLDGRTGVTTLGFLTGRLFVGGPVTLAIRDMRITIHGTATLVHFSWKDAVSVQALAGEVEITQGDTRTTLSPTSGAVQFSTIPTNLTQTPATIDQSGTPLLDAFYPWAQAYYRFE